MEELLAEVRSLRSEIRRASDTSIRAQLLVARLQVQEQRINTLWTAARGGGAPAQ